MRTFASMHLQHGIFAPNEAAWRLDGAAHWPGSAPPGSASSSCCSGCAVCSADYIDSIER